MQRLPGVVGEDGPPDAGGESASEKQRTETNFVCPRCEREFPCTEKVKWEEHCRRCRDD